MNRKSRSIWLLAILAMFAVLLTACGDDDKDSADDTTTTTAANSSGGATSASLGKLSATVNGQGSSFQDTFEQKVSSDFGAAVKEAGGSAKVTYSKTGSSDGKKALADKTVDFAGTDSALKPEETAAFGARKVLYFPITGGPISVAYNLSGVDELNLSADTLAKIFQATITTWNDPAIAAENPDATLPATRISVVHRSDGSGTTSNFTKFLKAAAPTTWTLDSGETVNWPASTQAAEKSTGVTSVIKQTNGAVGYVDLADAAKENLDVASVKGAGGDYVAPTPDSASEAIAAAEIAPDLTYNPLNAKGAKAYPITSPTWILVDAAQTDAAKAAVIKAYLAYIFDAGQDQAKSLLYAPLPDALKEKAVAQIDQITGG